MSYCEGGDMYNKIKEAEGKQFPEGVRTNPGYLSDKADPGLDGATGL